MSGTPPTPAPAALAAARALRTDLAAAEAIAALHDEGVDAILLRGPAIARRLYDAGEHRAYVDADLLVAPGTRRRAEAVLERLGYGEGLGEADFARDRHAIDWTRPRDHATVDLHWTIRGVTATEEELWAALSERAEPILLGGRPVLVPGPAGLALLVALHVAQHGDLKPKPAEDLRRAIERLPRPEWEEAGVLARRLGTEQAFAAGLRWVPGGAALARALAFAEVEWAEAELHRAEAPRGALTLYEIARRGSSRDRARRVWRGVFPTRRMLLRQHPGADRSRRTLALAYLTRLGSVAASLPAAVRAARAAARRR